MNINFFNGCLKQDSYPIHPCNVLTSLDVLSVRTWQNSPNLLLHRYLITREKSGPENDGVPSEFLPKILNLNITLLSTCHMFRNIWQDNPTLFIAPRPSTNSKLSA